MGTEEQLRWEAARRPWAAVVAVAAGALMLAGGILGVSLGTSPSPDDTSRLLFIDEHSGSLVASACLLAAGALTAGLAVGFLYLATRARRPELPRGVLLVPVLAGAAYAILQVAGVLLLASEASDFASTGAQTYDQADKALDAARPAGLQYLGLVATLSFAFAFVFVPLHAMRAGLLTRFMGILGIISGALVILPIGGPLPVVQAFWLLALGALLSGRWPSGVPPAWETGRAEPWPTQQELRERRERAEGKGAGRADPAPRSAGDVVAEAEAATAVAAGTAHPSSKKRKRKRRR